MFKDFKRFMGCEDSPNDEVYTAYQNTNNI